MARSRIQVAKPKIIRFFDNLPKKVFTVGELGKIFNAQRIEWKLAWGTNRSEFVEFLESETELQKVMLLSEHYDDAKRFAWRRASPFEVALSLKRSGYLTHGSAVFLHGLTDELPKVIYVNAEQSPKPRPSSMSQEGIDRAFARSPRQSKYTFLVDDLYRCVVLSGKFTNRLDVGHISGPDGELLEVTKIERTLIDITVRPHYAGGVHKVLEAFAAAKDHASINTLIALLRKLEYAYPYHQAIGFYLSRAGYPAERIARLQQFPMEFDFYLTYGIVDKDYDPTWKLFFPKGM